MKYKAVIFDLYGTLIGNTSDYSNWLQEMASIISAPESDFASLWHATFQKRMTGEFNKFQDCIDHVCRQLTLPVTKEQIERAANFRFDLTRQQVLNPQPHAIEIVSQLKANGYKIALLSNCSKETTIVWDETLFAGIFDVTVFSCSVGLMKPDPQIYRLAVEKLLVKTNECLYIADGMDGELKAAATMGMTPVRIRFPHANPDDPYLEEWSGATITSLKEVLDLVK
jgi:putative hydrolase of the HAD superfamily